MFCRVLEQAGNDAVDSAEPAQTRRVSPGCPGLAFAAVTTLVASLLFGLAPAWRLSKAELTTISKSGGSSHARQSLAVLIIGQIAFACVLLTSAGLLVQTFRALENVPLGFNPHNVLSVGIKLPGLTYREPAKQTRFYEQLLERIRSLPGVEAAALDNNIPFSGFRTQDTFGIAGRPESRPGEEPVAETHDVSPDYFRTMSIPLLRGRTLQTDDTSAKQLVIVIDEGLARKFFPQQNPTGQQLYFWEPDKSKTRYTIVGVVPTVRHGEVGIAPVISQVYFAHAQTSDLQTTLLVRTSTDPSTILPSVRSVVRSIDPQLPLFSARTMEDAAAASLGSQRLSAMLIGGFSILALFLAALGLYGVIACSVTQRTREIGIRLALGSARTHIFRLILRQGMILAIIGTLVGLAATTACAPLVGRFVYGVAPRDPFTLAAAAILLSAVALIACLLPAARAVRVDPVVALRQE